MSIKIKSAQISSFSLVDLQDQVNTLIENTFVKFSKFDNRIDTSNIISISYFETKGSYTCIITYQASPVWYNKAGKNLEMV